nr:immunoglobulin heavy chain junction region [Macaca mulatta]MOW77520.1 immunoglobulin heavy chain junction region [Macaca mulatta]MOW78486.1 immunoglobulin heavy chain junction region [Macaca mulatta]MOW78488.1 immunoglobulin heavy chain junction region [Macaca mulatta]MOW79023.1 immunoglobulin heavy chain junction region [Macaca mulatta]
CARDSPTPYYEDDYGYFYTESYFDYW